MNLTGLPTDAPFLSDSTTDFLQKRIDYFFNIRVSNESNDYESKIVPKHLWWFQYTTIFVAELDKDAKFFTDDELQACFQSVLVRSSRGLIWTSERYLDDIEYDVSIQNSTSRVRHMWKELITIVTKYGLQSELWLKVGSEREKSGVLQESATGEYRAKEE
jgi:hypothetical protein